MASCVINISNKKRGCFDEQTFHIAFSFDNNDDAADCRMFYRRLINF